MRSLACLALAGILATTSASCTAPTQTETTNNSSPPTAAPPLGKWVPSCTDASNDAKRLKEDISAGAPELLRAKSLTEDPFRRQALAAIAPLAACSDSYVRTQLASEIPLAWQTSGGERFARLISDTSRSSPGTSTPDNSGCPACQVSDTQNFTHPTWGQVRLETYTEGSLPTGKNSISGYRIVAQNDGRLLYDKAINDLLYELAIGPLSADGFMFITYNPGRYNGVIVLRATKDGIDDFGTDSFPRTYNGRFYYAEVRVESNRSFSVIRSQNNCVPSCAAGTITDTKFVYDESVDDLIPS